MVAGARYSLHSPGLRCGFPHEQALELWPDGSDQITGMPDVDRAFGGRIVDRPIPRHPSASTRHCALLNGERP
jgi:hypothetical protein